LIQTFDHIAVATHKNTTNNIIDWYNQVFEMKRYIVNKNDTEKNGFEVRTGETGMRLKAIREERLSSTGENSFVMVIVEPLQFQIKVSLYL